MTESLGQKVLITYNSPSLGKHPVRGMSTKTYYGYRRRGDQFEVYESDMRVRPDLFRPAAQPPPRTIPTVPSHRGRVQETANVLGARAIAEPVPEPPAPPEDLDTEPHEPDPYELPPPLEMAEVPKDGSATILEADLSTIDWGKTINKRHLKLLAENDITCLMDLIPLTEDNVLSIKGIGANVTRALFTKLREHS